VVRQLICTGNADEFFRNQILALSSEYVEIVSMKDTGIYNAMNIGLSYVESGWVMFLNGGDVLFSKESLVTILEAIKTSPTSYIQLQTLIGDKVSPARKFSKFQHYLGRRMHAHPSFLFKYDSQSLIRFDESYKIVGDFKFILELTRESKIDFKRNIVVTFEGGGVSSTNLETVVSEANMVRIQLCPHTWLIPLVRLWNLKVRFFSHL
jgi:glycosyltransferase involved in cell wall biosynthesis